MSAGYDDPARGQRGRLERGAVTGLSEAVLDAHAQAQQVDDTDREHFVHLAQVIGGGIPSYVLRVRRALRTKKAPVLQVLT